MKKLLKGKYMDILLKLKIALVDLFNSILQSPFNTFLATATIFFGSILIFALLYMFLHQFHLISVVNYKGKNIVGSAVPLPAFQVSDALKKRIEVKAKNDLRLRDFVGDSTNIVWQSFSQDDSASRQFPDQKGHWTEFKDMNVLGSSPTRMVEEIFPRYGLLKFKIISYRDNSFDSIFPIKVMEEYFRVQSVVDLQNRISQGQLNPIEQSLYNGLSAVAPQIRSGILQSNGEGRLFWLSESLKRFASDAETSAEDKTRFRDIFYGEILSTLAPPGTNIDFYFDTLPLYPEPLDFLYMSTTLATSNMPSEVIPITTDVRFLMWAQLMISYFILALNVAALIKLIKIG